MIRIVVAARKAANLHQATLAERLGKPQSFISKVERRERRIDMVELVVIARAIGAHVPALLAEIERAIPEDAQL